MINFIGKGLGCPVGSVIVGSKQIIERAIRVRKVLGGGWRQAGVLAAAGLYALDHQVDRIKDDHEHAKMMEEMINSEGRGKFVVKRRDTNLVIVRVDPSVATPEEIVAKLQAGPVCVLGIEFASTEFRLTFHCDISQQLALMACDKMKEVIKIYI